jgi:hypothetical protein
MKKRLKEIEESRIKKRMILDLNLIIVFFVSWQLFDSIKLRMNSFKSLLDLSSFNLKSETSSIFIFEILKSAKADELSIDEDGNFIT